MHDSLISRVQICSNHLLREGVVVVINVKLPTPVFSDSLSAIFLAKINDLQGRSKHMGRRLFSLRERVRDGKVQLTHIASKLQPADFFMKVSPTKEFQRFSRDVGLISDTTRTAYLLTIPPTPGWIRGLPTAGWKGGPPATGWMGGLPAAGWKGGPPPAGWKGGPPATGWMGGRPAARGKGGPPPAG